MATINWRGKNKDTAYLQWHEHGRRVKRSLGKVTREDAETLRLAKELELRTNNTVTGITLNQFSPRYIKWHELEYPYSHERIRQIINHHITPFFGNYPIDTIPPVSIEDYKHTRRQKVRTETVNKELRTLVAVINKAAEWGVAIKPLKVKYLKDMNSRPVRFFSHDELNKIYEASTDNCIWKFLANTGLRRGEFLNLKPGDIRHGYVYIESAEGGRTKSGKWRSVPLSPGAKDALKCLSFPVKIQGPAMSIRFSRVLRKLKIKGSLHTLRHTFCSHLVMNGVNLSTVQQLAGHSTIRITEQYAHLSPEHLANSTQNLDL